MHGLFVDGSVTRLFGFIVGGVLPVGGFVSLASGVHLDPTFLLILFEKYVMMVGVKYPFSVQVTIGGDIVEYIKATVNDAEVVQLAKSLGVSTKEVVAVINQQRYRKAYAQKRNAEMKALRKLIKQHPELIEVHVEREVNDAK